MSPKLKIVRKMKAKEKAKAANQTPEMASASSGSKPTLPAGARVRRSTLRQQAATSIELGTTYAAPMARADWSPQSNVGLQDDAAAYDEAYESFEDAREASKQDTLVHQGVIEESMTLRDQVISAIKAATQGEPNPFRQERLQLSPTRTPKELGVWFQAVQTEVKKNQASLAAQLGTDPVALVAAQSSKLMKSIGVQTERRLSVKDMSQKQKAAKVKLAQTIERQRLAAGVAFPRNKDMLEKFVPIWEKRKRRASKPSPVEASDGASASAQAATEVAPAKPAASAPANAKS